MIYKKGKAKEIEWQNEKQWINSSPLKLENLRGKIVLIDFWAYSCVNCIRTFDSLKQIWNKYKNKRFILIGIHTPEFEFEKESGNVKYAVKKYTLEYPILNDPERINWENYGNTYWPRIALINTEGDIIFEHVGESGYDEVEKKIIEELIKLKEIPEDIETISLKKRNYEPGVSKETYAGSERNAGIPGKVCTKEGCDEYHDSGNYAPGVIYLQGEWNQTREYVEYLGKPEKGRICYRYYASEVNVVMAGVGEVEVLLDTLPIRKEDAGEDVFFREGKSYVKVEGAEMYNIVKHSNYHSRVLRIIPFEELKVYAYTFG
ncbi:MAG: redoxin family protein [Nanoarchaeota archaeon]